MGTTKAQMRLTLYNALEEHGYATALLIIADWVRCHPPCPLGRLADHLAEVAAKPAGAWLPQPKENE